MLHEAVIQRVTVSYKHILEHQQPTESERMDGWNFSFGIFVTISLKPKLCVCGMRRRCCVSQARVFASSIKVCVFCIGF